MARGATNIEQITSVSNYAMNVGGMYQRMNNDRLQMKEEMSRPMGAPMRGGARGGMRGMSYG